MKKIAFLFIGLILARAAVAAPMTAGYVQKAASGTVVEDSVIYQNGANIGIGITSPSAKLAVDGSVYVLTGNVGIGSATPRSRLDVDGAVYGTAFHGDGSKLTGVTGGVSDLTPITLDGTNVGIGTTVPTVGLHIGAGSPSWTVAMVNPIDAFVRGDMEVDGALYVDGFIYGNGSKLTGITGGSSQWTGTSPIYYAGNVGINTTAPTAALEINGDIKANTGYFTGTNVSQYAGNMLLVGDSAVAVTFANTIGDLYVQDDIESDGTIYAAELKATGIMYGGEPTLVTGTSPIVAKAGSLYLENDLYVDGVIYGLAYIKQTGSSNGTSSGIIIQPISDNIGANSFRLWSDGTNGRIDGGSDFSKNLYINGTTGASGNVGIGTATAAQKLQIKGTLIQMQSPDGSWATCGPANDNTWSCTGL